MDAEKKRHNKDGLHRLKLGKEFFSLLFCTFAPSEWSRSFEYIV